MKETFDYNIAECYGVAIINDDWTGLEDEDIVLLEKFLNKNKGHWIVNDMDAESDFIIDEVSGLRADCIKMNLTPPCEHTWKSYTQYPMTPMVIMKDYSVYYDKSMSYGYDGTLRLDVLSDKQRDKMFEILKTGSVIALRKYGAKLIAKEYGVSKKWLKEIG